MPAVQAPPRPRWLRLIGALGLLVLLAAVPAAAGQRAASPAGTLREPGQVVTWQGRRFEVGAAEVPQGCTPETCETFLATVRLGDHWVTHPRAALEFAIRWPSEYDDFDLYVERPDGSPVPSVQSNVGSAESAFDLHPVNGAYKVTVVPKLVTGSAYEGAIQVEPARRFEGPPRDLLPNLVTLPPRRFHVVAPVFYQTDTPLEVAGLAPLSCYVDESAETGHTRCLRFDNVIANVGAGDLRMRLRYDGIASDRSIQQVIVRTDGSVRHRPAGRYEFHAVHGHFHYEGFARFQLYAVDPRRGTLSPVGEGVKSGFCLEDTELHWWARRGNGPMGITFPDCDLPRYSDQDGVWGVMGITRGWADVYTWDLPDQYVPIEGLPDGLYVLETMADPAGTVLETDERDNAAWALLQIVGDEVRVLDSGRGRAGQSPGTGYRSSRAEAA